MQGLDVTLQRHNYIHCQLECESEMPNLQYTWPNPGWAPQAPAIRASIILHNHACQNRAHFRNLTPVGGPFNEPSFCVEPQTVPRVGMHPAPHPVGRILVCQPCKSKRAFEFDYRKTQIAIGVCFTCERWALKNMAVGQNDCDCEPAGNYANGYNNHEPRYWHLCKEHDIYYWFRIARDANTEIQNRRMMYRIRKKKRGNGWTHVKGLKQTKTPDQRRRQLTARLLPGSAMFAVPRCYCGTKIAEGRHEVDGPLAPWVPTARVRNCTGCNKFTRRW